MEKPEPNCGGWEDKKKTLLVAGVDVHSFAKFESAVGNLSADLYTLTMPRAPIYQSIEAETHQILKI